MSMTDPIKIMQDKAVELSNMATLVAEDIKKDPRNFELMKRYLSLSKKAHFLWERILKITL